MKMDFRPRAADAPATDPGSLAGRLTLLGTQMLKLAGEVSRRDAAPNGPGAGPLDCTAADEALLGLLAEEAYRDRRRRARHLPTRLLGEQGLVGGGTVERPGSGPVRRPDGPGGRLGPGRTARPRAGRADYPGSPRRDLSKLKEQSIVR